MTSLNQFIKATTEPAVTETTVVELAPAVINIQIPLVTAELLVRLLGKVSGVYEVPTLYDVLNDAIVNLNGDPNRFQVNVATIRVEER